MKHAATEPPSLIVAGVFPLGRVLDGACLVSRTGFDDYQTHLMLGSLFRDSGVVSYAIPSLFLSTVCGFNNRTQTEKVRSKV